MSAAEPTTLSWRPTPEELRAYSGELRVRPGENTHTSLDMARAADMPNLIVQGHHTLAVGIELLRAEIGADSTPATVAAKFVAPIFVEDEVTFRLEPMADNDGAWKITAHAGENVALVADVMLRPTGHGGG